MTAERNVTEVSDPDFFLKVDEAMGKIFGNFYSKEWLEGFQSFFEGSGIVTRCNYKEKEKEGQIEKILTLNLGCAWRGVIIKVTPVSVEISSFPDGLERKDWADKPLSGIILLTKEHLTEGQKNKAGQLRLEMVGGKHLDLEVSGTYSKGLRIAGTKM